MTESIIVALITGSMSLIGVVISNLTTAQKANQSIKTMQAVTDTKLEELTREVREHNNFAQRIPVLEEKVKVVNHRLEDLEKKEEMK